MPGSTHMFTSLHLSLVAHNKHSDSVNPLIGAHSQFKAAPTSHPVCPDPNVTRLKASFQEENKPDMISSLYDMTSCANDFGHKKKESHHVGVGELCKKPSRCVKAKVIAVPHSPSSTKLCDT